MRVSDLQKRVLAGQKYAFLLDDYPNAAAAYSLRKLRSAYTGNCIEVRRSSDNALQNIGFVNNVLDTASLLSFVGAGNGFVRTWYDQSGNNRNYLSSNNVNQPAVVLNGALYINLLKPAINFDGVNHQFIMSPRFNTLNFNHYQVFLNTKGDYIMHHGNISEYSEIAQISASTALFANYGTPSYRINGVNPNFTTRTSVRNKTFNINVLQTTNNANNNVWGSIGFSVQFFAGFRFGGFVNELIYYSTNKTADNLGIESNINSYYNIY
jgi:hypothetical protein